MPYLHWELDRQRKTFSSIIEKRSVLHSKDLRTVGQYSPNHQQGRLNTFGGISETLFVPPANDMADVVNQSSPPRSGGRGQLHRGRDGRLEIKNPLGKLLYHAVKLFNAMDNFRDQRLIDKYLMHNPPLHPRRTLDQAYFWSLRNSHARDRDQVVYRATSAPP